MRKWCTSLLAAAAVAVGGSAWLTGCDEARSPDESDLEQRDPVQVPPTEPVPQPQAPAEPSQQAPAR